MRIALIGLGAIGQEFLRSLASVASETTVVGALVAHPERYADAPCPVFETLEQVIAVRPAMVVECARHAAVKAYGARVLASGLDLLVASVGALADDDLFDACKRAADAGRSQLLIPSGALAGIDALAAARLVGLDKVVYIRRAPPSTLVRSGALSEEEVARHATAFQVYAGSARAAALKYPKNANVAAAVALAGLGFDRTEVKVIADPALVHSVHVIEAAGGFGEMRTEISTRAISAATTSSRIVAGSLARAVLARSARIVV